MPEKMSVYFDLEKKSFLKNIEKIIENFCHKLDDYKTEPSEDNIHDMRVAIRRLESTHRVLPKAVRMKQSIQNYVKHAKMLFKLSAKMRDYDIICNRFESNYKNKTLDLVITLKNQRFELLQDANKLATKMASIKPPKISEIMFKESKLKKRYKKILGKILSNIDDNVLISLGDEKKIKELHMLRKDFKKFRYALELSSNKQRTINLLKRLKKIQNILGEIHDTDIIIDYLNGIKQRSKFNDIIESEVLERRKKYNLFVSTFKEKNLRLIS